MTMFIVLSDIHDPYHIDEVFESLITKTTKKSKYNILIIIKINNWINNK